MNDLKLNEFHNQKNIPYKIVKELQDVLKNHHIIGREMLHHLEGSIKEQMRNKKKKAFAKRSMLHSNHQDVDFDSI